MAEYQKPKTVIETEQLFLLLQGGDRATWAKKFQEDREFKLNNQWDDIDKAILDERNQMAIPVNEVLPAVDLVVATLTENDPRFKAVGREASDNKLANDISELFTWIWYISKGRVKIEKFVRDFVEGGMAALMAYTDPFADNGKGEVKFIDLDPLHVYVDPHCKDPDGSDASDIIISKVLTKQQIRQSYPKFSFEGAVEEMSNDYTGSSLSVSEDQIFNLSDLGTFNKYRVIDRYQKVQQKTFHVYDPFTDFENTFEEMDDYIEWSQSPALIVTYAGRESYITRPDDIDAILELVDQYGNTFHQMIDPVSQQPVFITGVENEPTAIPNSTRRVKEVTIADLINEGQIKHTTPLQTRIKRTFTIGGKLVKEYVMPKLRDYPIVLCMLHHSRNPFPIGDIRLVRPLQQQLNKIDNLIITYNQNITNVKWFVDKGSGAKEQLEEKGGKAGTQIIEGNFQDNNIPTPVQLTAMSASFYTQRENLIRQIQRIIGAYSFQDGDASHAPETRGGTILIDEFMQRRTALKKRKIEASLNQLAKVIMQLIPITYTERKIIRLLRPNNKDQKEVIFNSEVMDESGQITYINNLSNAELDVQVISGSMMPTNKMQRREELMNYYINNVLRNPRPIIQELDLPNVDEILEDEDLIKQQGSMIEQLQAQIKDLEGQVQTLIRENIHKDQKLAVEKFETKLNKSINRVERDVEINKTQMQSKVKDKNNGNGSTQKAKPKKANVKK